ncbi:MAG: putative DNA modification/repair radical SAM protein [Polyangiales bacterium]
MHALWVSESGDIRHRLAVLADAAKYDASCASSGSYRAGNAQGIGNTEGMGICHSYTPDGRCVSLLKILLTNYCIYDCQYCVNRISSDVERARFEPEEVASLTIEFYRRNYIEGLFLSSGVLKSPDFTMERMVRVAELLRDVHHFGGYIHLKAVPGASDALLRRAGHYADRLSANLELVTDADLAKLAPEKKRDDVDAAMRAIAQEIEAASELPRHARAVRAGFAEDGSAVVRNPQAFAPAGQSTQIIVGATPTSDRMILSSASELYRTHHLRRVYYSAFSPIPHADPRLPIRTPPLVREHRLYQADWLIRFYDFEASELTAVSENLDLELDPKLAWAIAHRELFPVDVNVAAREQLLRVPGLGVRNVERILSIRRHRSLRLEDLRALRVPMRRTAPFVITADSVRAAAQELDTASLERRLRKPQTAQLDLFETAASARSGEL